MSSSHSDYSLKQFFSLHFAQMEKNAAAGRTFGSIPVATPPPVSSSAVTQSKPATSFQLRSRGQGLGMETSSSHGLHGFGDESGSVYMGLDAKSTDSSEMLPLKSSAGHNVMVVSQGKGTSSRIV